VTDASARFTTTLEHVLEIDASPDTVFSMWTTAAGLCSWWGATAEVDPRPGGALRVCLEGGPIMRGEYLALEAPHRIVFNFGWETPPPEGELPPGSTRVEVTIEATATGSRVTLRHHDLPLEHFGNHARGWTHFFGDRLATAVFFERSQPNDR
jgi:uncharacterized protein YndB with AHSA1/START domain